MTRDAGAPVVHGRVRRPPAEGLRRDRLVKPLTAAGCGALVLLVAPAGCGKTTLLSHLADVHRGPVAWLALDHGLADEAALLAHLQLALQPVLTPGTGPGPWTTSDDMLADLDHGCRAGSLLVLDDLHSLRGGTGAAVIGRLLRHRPPRLRLVLASRAPTGLDVWHLALRGEVRSVGADALRFRTWEVEELFRQRRGVAGLRPEELALLTRRTEGWAAGLQLFDLATRRMPPSDRSRLLQDPTRSGLLTREYLAQHVVAGVSEDVRRFLLRSSVLRELTPSRCDQVLEMHDSERCLRACVELGLVAPGDSGAGPAAHLHHDVLRLPLLAMATTEYGAAAVAALHRRAGHALRSEGYAAEAVASFASAGDWPAVGDTVATCGRELADLPGTWLDVLPTGLRENDPWVALAVARRLLAEGRLSGAVQAYTHAHGVFGTEAWDSIAGEEARSLSTWADPPLGEVGGWVSLARRALLDPVAVTTGEVVARDSPGHRLARGVALLVQGRVGDAATELAGALGGPSVPRSVEATALLAHGAALSLAVDPRAGTVRQQAARAADLLGAPVLQRLAEGVELAASGQPAARLQHLVSSCRDADDVWGELLLRLVAAVAALPGRAPAAMGLADLAGQLTDARAPALATWARVCEAVAGPDPGAAEPRAEPRADVVRAAAALGPLPHALALLAVGGGAPRAADGLRRASGAQVWLRAVAVQRALAPPPRARAGAADHPGARADAAGLPLQVGCMSGFSLTRGGVPVAVAALRPRHRALLRALCLHAGELMHREVLMSWFWPEQDPVRATRNLQVAISAVRRLVEDGDPAGPVRLRRDGDAYWLDLGRGSSDVQILRTRLAAVSAARAKGDATMLEAALVATLEAAPGEVLPDDGPAEWVVVERDRLRLAAAAAALELARLQAGSGRYEAAVGTAAVGLWHDGHCDPLWALLLTCLERTGRPAEAARARRRYEAVVADLLDPHLLSLDLLAGAVTPAR